MHKHDHRDGPTLGYFVGEFGIGAFNLKFHFLLSAYV